MVQRRGFNSLNSASGAKSKFVNIQVYQNALDVRLNYFGGDNLRVNMNCFSIIKPDIRIYMSPIAGQTTGPNGLKFFMDTKGFMEGVSAKKNRIFFV